MGTELNFAQTGAPVSGNHTAQAIEMSAKDRLELFHWQMSVGGIQFGLTVMGMEKMISSLVGPNHPYPQKLGAGHAGALAAYLKVGLDHILGNNPREWWGSLFRNKDAGTYWATYPAPGYGSGAGKAIPGESGAYSEMVAKWNPATTDHVGFYYAHFRPMDLIRNQPGDVGRESGGKLFVAAAPGRGDINAERRPVYQGYDGATGRFIDNKEFAPYRESGW
jgi:hypothetical protein